MIPVAELKFFPLIVQAVLYGIYLATFVHYFWGIIDDYEVRWRKINWLCILLFLLSTTDLLLQFWMTVGPAMSGDIPALEVLTSVTGTLENTTLLITDAVLIYRCWAVYAKAWRLICLPLITWLSCFISAILLAYCSAVFGLSTTARKAIWAFDQFYRFENVFFSSNIITNVYATSAITYRISRAAMQNCGNSAPLLNISRILAESGALYTLTSALALIANAINTQYRYDLNLFRYISIAINFSMAGIAFNLILIRVRNKLDPESMEGFSKQEGGKWHYGYR